jgi:DHA2 family multidrug resistance protein
MRSELKANKWAIALTVMLPTFIEIMDTSVVNVSLPHLQGSLNAGLDEVTWVLTSYLVSNAIIIPISGWLSAVFGRKRYLLFCLFMFVGSSVLCGAAPSLAVLVLARILQGIGGGGLQPLSQAILLETFPQSEHGMAMAFFGMGIVLAPIMGPVVGGWITDNWSWRWIFYINFPVGLLAVFLIMIFIQDPAYIRRRQLRIDRWGLVLLTIGLGCLQIVLDKGEREDWFNSQFIIVLSIIAVGALIAFVLVELRIPHPVVNLRVFRHKSFTSGSLTMFAGFFALFGALVLLPLYVQKLMGYTALWAGLVLGPGGMASFFVMPMAGFLMRKGVNPRNLLALGLATITYSLWLMSGFNLEASFYAISLPRVVLGFGMGLFFVPLATATFVDIPKEATGNASGIFNLLRNLGGSFGIAFSTTILAQRAQAHQNFLVENITPYNPAFQHYFNQIEQWLRTYHPEMSYGTGPMAFIYEEVLRQANMMSFNDCFWILSWFTATLIPLTLFLRKTRTTAEVPMAH